MSKATPRRLDNETDAHQAIERNPHSGLAYYPLGCCCRKTPPGLGETEAVYWQAVELERTRYVYRLGLFLHQNLRRLTEAESAYR